MHKVLVERPRWNPGPSKQRRHANLPDELLPKVEGIKRPHMPRKAQRDLFGPLRRWLRTQVGRPWNDVYSEACGIVDSGDYVRVHVKTHLLEFVERNTFMQDGKVCVLDRGYRGGITPIEKLTWSRTLFFVHPETGLLQSTPQISKRVWRDRQPKPTVTRHWLSKGVALQQIRGLWFECRFEVVPVGVRFKAYDYALEREVGRGGLARYEDSYLLCTSKRQLGKRALRRFGLRNVFIAHSVEVQVSARTGCVLKPALRCFIDRLDGYSLCLCLLN
jgi:hypothetical protein